MRNKLLATTATITILASAAALLAGDISTAIIGACSAAAQIANIGEA